MNVSEIAELLRERDELKRQVDRLRLVVIDSQEVGEIDDAEYRLNTAFNELTHKEIKRRLHDYNVEPWKEDTT